MVWYFEAGRVVLWRGYLLYLYMHARNSCGFFITINHVLFSLVIDFFVYMFIYFSGGAAEATTETKVKKENIVKDEPTATGDDE